MKWIEKSAMFFLGGVGYVSLELVWRGWSHFSMFLAGGSCFLLLGRLDKVENCPLWAKGILGSAIITAVEEKLREKASISSMAMQAQTIIALGSGFFFIFFSIRKAASRIRRPTAILIP